MELVAEEVRVAGCLIEKRLTTPQQYPLTLNALVAACNQSSSRSPITSYGDRTVESALVGLKEKGLVRFVHPSQGRSATRYRHVLDEALGLEPAELALLGTLMLRGAQTPGELRARTERMTTFEGSEDVEAALKVLADRDEPLVVRLHREPGRREVRYAHLLSGAESALQSADDEPGSGGVRPPFPVDERYDDGGPSGPTERGTQGPSGPTERGTQGPSGPTERGTQGDTRPEVPIAEELMALRARVSALGRALDHILARLNR